MNSHETYLAECYWPDVTLEQLTAGLDRLSRATAELAGEGVEIRLVRSALVPREEAILCFFEATSADAVRTAGERAQFPLERVSEALAFCGDREGSNEAAA